MASSSANDGIHGGAGGKFRRTISRKPLTTPYDRPITALRPTQIIKNNNNNNNNNNTGWLSKLITSGTNKIFSSVFRKRLLPPPSPPHLSDEGDEAEYMCQETAANVVDDATKVLVDCGANSFSQPSDNNEVSELEDMLKQKTFTRSEIDQLTALMLSRASENVNGAKKGMSEPKHLDLQTVVARRDKLSNLPARGNVLEHALPGAISTPEGRSKVLPDDVASPAEIAKAYMASRFAEVSPQVSCLQNRLRQEELSTPYNPLSNLISPAVYLTQKDLSDVGTSSNGFMRSRFQGTSGIYSRARTPYSRAHAVIAFKAPESGFSYHNVTENNQYRRRALKRRNSVLENDIGFVGPIRRIRQKPNFLHPKTLSLPSPGARQATHISGVLSDISEVRSSVDCSSQNHSVSKGLAANRVLGMNSSRNVPSQSIKMAQKIFEQLDKFSPQGNPRKSTDVSVGNSLAKKLGLESPDSLKLLPGSQDVKKLKGSLDSVHGHIYQSERSSMVEKLTAKMPTSPLASQDGVDSRDTFSYAPSTSKAAEYMMPLSIVDRPLKQRAFQTSGHKYPELDENAPSIEVALSTPFSEGGRHAESPRTSVAIPDQTMAVEKPSEPSTATKLGRSGLESIANNSSAFEKNFSFPSVFLPTSPANMTTPDVICAPQFTLQSEKAPSQCQKSTSFAAFSSKSENLPSFVSTPLSAASDTKVEITVSANKVAAEVDGPDKTKSTPMFGNAFFKSGDSSSADPLSTGSQTNNRTLLNGVLSTVPPKINASCPVALPNTSTYKISVPASVSPSSSVAGLTSSNVEAQPTFASSICATETCSTSLLPGSVTFSFGSGFPLSSSTSATSASINTNNSCNKSNATVCLVDAKPCALISGGSTFSEKNTGVDVQFSGLGASNKLPFSFQTASTPSFLGGSTSSVLPSASTSAMSLGGTIGLSSGSIFGSYPLTLGPTTVSSSLGSSFTSSSISTSSSTAPSSIFGFTSHSKPTTTIAPDSPSPTFSFHIGSSGAASSSIIFGAMPITNSPKPTSTIFPASSSPTISFGLGSSGATTSSSSLIFGGTPTTNLLTVSNSGPFVFGGNSASTPALCNSPFADNDPMTMEDTMADDSLQPVPPFVAPLSAPIGGFGSNAAPIAGSPFQFNSQQSPVAPQNSLFQPSGSLEFNGGSSSFSLGTSDKSQRRIVRVKKTARRK